MNQETYPEPENFLNDVEQVIPDTLKIFLEDLMVKSRKKIDHSSALVNKSIATAHTIMAAIRPRSFHSSLLVSVAIYLHRRHGSRQLVDLLAALGFCASYDEVKLFETSAMNHPPPKLPDESFFQYIFDNADHNMITLDGKDTFHALGGIRCLTPYKNLVPSLPIKRLKACPTAEITGNIGQIPFKYFNLSEKGNLDLRSI